MRSNLTLCSEDYREQATTVLDLWKFVRTIRLLLWMFPEFRYSLWLPQNISIAKRPSISSQLTYVLRISKTFAYFKEGFIFNFDYIMDINHRYFYFRGNLTAASVLLAFFCWYIAELQWSGVAGDFKRACIIKVSSSCSNDPLFTLQI